MKEQIIVYYNKDKYNKYDYIVKRVFTQYGEYYSLTSYYMIDNKLIAYPSKLKFSFKEFKGIVNLNSFLLQCKKSTLFNKIEYNNIMEV